jgi:acylphosphatase
MAHNANEIVRAHIVVKGRVQGVGFRAFVEFNAGKIGVTGWVRNIGYDQVETVAEGTRNQVERFILAVKTGPRAARVDECNVTEEAPTGEFKTFDFRHSL